MRRRLTWASIAWSLVTGATAYLYIARHIRAPGNEGYELRWDWQLAFFALTVLPYLVVGWVVTLLLIRVLHRRARRAAPAHEQ